MYSLPKEFWDPAILEGIGNTLGSFIMVSEVTKTGRYISYDRICVYMNLAGALRESIIVSYQDEEWNQPLDYEHIPFRSRKCHVHGHLLRYYPLNATKPSNKAKGETNQEGFSKITRKRKVGRRPPKQLVVNQAKNTTNRFQVVKGEPSEPLVTENPKVQKEETKKAEERWEELPKRRKTTLDLGKE